MRTVETGKNNGKTMKSLQNFSFISVKGFYKIRHKVFDISTKMTTVINTFSYLLCHKLYWLSEIFKRFQPSSLDY